MFTVIVVGLIGCGGGAGADGVDADGDGFATGADCDDNNAAVHPDAPEVCDGIDNDCDAAVDDADTDVDPADAAGVFHLDADGDGFGDPATALVRCKVPADRVADGTDCDDEAPAVFPGSPDVCGAGGERDCDPSTVGDGVRFVPNTGEEVLHPQVRPTSEAGAPLTTLVLDDPGALYVCAGEWVMSLDIRADVDVVGIPSSEEVGIWAWDPNTAQSAPGIVVQGGTATISGLAVRAFTSIPVGIDNLGGGLHCGADAQVAATDLVIEDALQNSEFGGAVSVLASCELTLVDSVVQRGEMGFGARSGSGGMMYVAGTAMVENTRFAGGDVDTVGGAILVEDGALTCTDCTLLDNTAAAGGAIAVVGDAIATLSGGEVAGNTADAGAVAVLLWDGAGNPVPVLDLMAVELADNGPGPSIATIDNDGGTFGFYPFDDGTVTVTCDGEAGC